MALRHLQISYLKQNRFIVSLLLIFLLGVIPGRHAKSQGLEAIIVEKIPVSAEALSDDSNLQENSFTYRVFADMDSAYELQAVFALDNHELFIETTTAFYNNNLFGSTTGIGIISNLLSIAPSLYHDSYITINAATNNKLAVMMDEDTTDGVVDGLINGTALPLQTVGENFDTPFGSELFSGKFSTFQGIYSVIGGEVGPTPSNRVLIGQFTTDGDFSFELNVQIRPVGTGDFEQYVARNPIEDEILFEGLIYPGNTPPQVSIVSPEEGSFFSIGEEVLIEASAEDENGIASVEFFVNGNSVAIDSVEPFETAWTAAEGTAILTAVATDSLGLSGTSDPVEVTVSELIAPIVAITSPVESAQLIVNEPYTIHADASDADGEVVKVEFYANEILLGEDISTPFEWEWTPLTADTVTLSAKAIDDDALEAVSEPVVVFVGIQTGLPVDEKSLTITVYPNPASSRLKISIDSERTDGSYRLELIDLRGEVVFLSTLVLPSQSEVVEQDISQVPSGVYLLRITNASGHVGLQSIVIE